MVTTQDPTYIQFNTRT